MKSFAANVLTLATVVLLLALAAHNPAQSQETPAKPAAPNTLTTEQIAAGWINLFDGETLFGWQPTSDANWSVESGEIHVSAGAPGWLMTTSDFADYELHVEFKAPATTNSGVFLRTPLDPKDPATDCYELNIAPQDNPFPTASLVGRAKVSTSPGASRRPRSSDEPRRLRGGPIRGLDPWDGDWHKFDLVVKRSAVQISLDERLLLSLVSINLSAAPSRGRIGLQFREGEVAFRNIRLKPLGMKPMLVSAKLEGWRTDETRDATFTLIDPSGSLPLEGATSTVASGDRAQAVVRAEHRAGEGGAAGTSVQHPSLTLPLKGRGPEGAILDPPPGPSELHITSGPGELETESTYADFILQLDCYVDGDNLNSGVFFRSIPGEFANGYESQIHNGVKDSDPSKPLDAGTGAIYRRTTARRVVSKDHEWFTKTIVATGPHIAVWVDGYQVTDWTDDRQPDPNPRKGLRLEPGTISLQAHDPTTNIRLRNLRIVELPQALEPE